MNFRVYYPTVTDVQETSQRSLFMVYIPIGLVIESLLQLCVIGPQGWGEKGEEGRGGVTRVSCSIIIVDDVIIDDVTKLIRRYGDSL